MAVGCRAVASERRDACQRARLRPYITIGVGTFHPLFQRTVDACYGQGGVELAVDVLIVA